MPGIKRLTLGLMIFDHIDCHAFLQAIIAWFPALTHLSIRVLPETVLDIQARVGQLQVPFSVDIGSLDNWWVDL